MSGMEPRPAPRRIRKRLSLAPRDGAQVLARSVHLHPGCHGSPWRVRMFVRRHTAQAIAREEQCPCDGREPCPRHPCFQGLVLQLPAQDCQTQAEGHTQAISHPGASRHAQHCGVWDWWCGTRPRSRQGCTGQTRSVHMKCRHMK